jgi:hypothetical protein
MSQEDIDPAEAFRAVLRTSTSAFRKTGFNLRALDQIAHKPALSD